MKVLQTILEAYVNIGKRNSPTITQSNKPRGDLLSASPLPLLQVLTPPSSPGHKQQLTKIGTALFAVCAVLLSLPVLLLIISKTKRESTEIASFCNTEDCLLHATLLTVHLNKSIRPCDNFSAYVCSAWTSPAEYRWYSLSTMEDVMLSWFHGFNATLHEGSVIIPTGRKAVAMYESCMGEPADPERDRKLFSLFLRTEGLPWPNESQKNSSALGTLLSLIFKWQAPFWFHARILRVQSLNIWRLVITPGPYINVFLNQYRDIRGSGGYIPYWRQFENAFGLSNQKPVNVSFINKVAKMEGYILHKLHKVLSHPFKKPVQFLLSEIEIYTPNVSAADWLQEIELAMPLVPQLSVKDELLAIDVHFIQTIGKLLTKYDDHLLRVHLAWVFVQLYGPIADPQLLVTRFGDKTRAAALRPLACAHHVEVSYRVLLLALRFVSSLTQQDREAIDARYDILTSAAFKSLDASTWLDEESKQLAKQKLAAVKMRLWPTKYLRHENLREVYKSFPEKEDSFLNYWIHTREKLRISNMLPEFEDEYNLPQNFAPPYLQYDDMFNNVAVSIGAINKPLYYRNGTKGMFYGGLGFGMALQLVKALDDTGLGWHPNGSLVKSFLSQPATKAFQERDGCLKTKGSTSIFPEIPAMEIGYTAFRDAVNNSNSPKNISDELTEDVVFFMTMCYMMCTRPSAHHRFAVDCNKAVQNSHVFAKVFNCAPGSKMNPAQKCSFFY